uniref:NADH-ubiquinone oxidoreductase chain 5 n=1 Tax=Echinaster brasiliensis TaxID=1681203 RepID=A0A343XBL6_9ECHI|nr:NADH dehydrogenase subunit 5 [Echinaster brasiliensis]AWK29630.1 NADH dehydrogenase subunit 5 [Echinaster brasiliensis]
MIITTLISTSTNISIIIILFLLTLLTYNPIILTSNNTNRNFNISNNSFFSSTLQNLALVSLIPLTINTISQSPLLQITIHPWINNNTLPVNLELNLDLNFNIFLSTALFVSWSIIQFSLYYMNNTPLPNNFFRLLIIFLLNMIILTSTNNLFLIFIGWEGVGFLSFLLISWWTTRNSANNAAIQAIIYNRIGDIGILTFFALSLLNFNSWSLPNINNTENFHVNILLLGILLAATGKSAQFGLHPWLPAAMEGPTPVSALLHSSTMVVAGIFLLIRLSPIYNNYPNFNNWALILGAITAIFAATTAISQHDLKKIIAYSTTSQLGLMMVAIGLNQPNIALFHICTHAFFKAMLFLSSGSIIHNLSDEQDIRKMGGLHFIIPNTSACIVLGSLALSGTPFLSGFYSKDLIIETGLTNISNLISISLALAATALTSSYSTRILFFCFMQTNNDNPSPNQSNNANLTNPLNRLAIGTILSGWLISNLLLFNETLQIQTLLKNLALIVTTIGLISTISILPTLQNHHIINTNIINFSSNQWFFQNTLHSIMLTLTFTTSLLFSTRNLDQGWNENLTAQGTAQTIQNISQNYQNTQTGYIKQYLATSTLTMLTLILLTLSTNYLVS